MYLIKNIQHTGQGSRSFAERLAVFFTERQVVWSETAVDCVRDFGGPLLEKANGFDAVTALGKASVEHLTKRVSFEILKRSR